MKNFACVEIHPQTKKLLVYLKTDPSSITLEPGFTRDVTKIGHFDTGNLEVVISSRRDLELACASGSLHTVAGSVGKAATDRREITAFLT